MTKCPFVDPEFELDNHIPCPVCGMLGFPPSDDEDLCVDNEPPQASVDVGGGRQDG